MKHLIAIMALSGTLVFGQAAGGEKVSPKTAERELTNEESLRFQLMQSRVARLRDKYKISDYEAEAQQLLNEGRETFVLACKSIGIPDDKIESECMYTTGVDAEGKVVQGPDGKPVKARVWRQPAPEKK